MSYPNRDGAAGAKAALLASNPALGTPSVGDRLDDHEGRISALEHPDGQSEHSDVTQSGDDS